jgi:hypothetical protein
VARYEFSVSGGIVLGLTHVSNIGYRQGDAWDTWLLSNHRSNSTYVFDQSVPNPIVHAVSNRAFEIFTTTGTFKSG